MGQKVYLIYADILGFQKIPEQIAGKFNEYWVSNHILSEPFDRKVKEIIKRRNLLSSKGISDAQGSDNYVLAVDNISVAFEIIAELSTIKTPHEDYEFIPFEIALDAREIGETFNVPPIDWTPVKMALKNNIISPYHDYRRSLGRSIKESFVLFTCDFFNELDSWDKQFCTKLSYKGKVFFVADLGKIKRRVSVYKFLEKIGCRRDDRWYRRIDDIYIPPSNRNKLKKALSQKRFLFITGTQECGKTYNAVRLMWEYYQQGYEPRWVKGSERRERELVRTELENMALKPKTIVYYEDPFGQTDYEKKEGLERGIGTTLYTVKHVPDVYVIITSREEVFQTFELEKTSLANLKEFEVKLNLKSYSYKKRSQMLLDWATDRKCAWMHRSNLRDFVLNSIKDEEMLPTALSIKDFAVVSANTIENRKLRSQLLEKSKETAISLAKEIKGMSDDKVLLLCFLFVSKSFPISFIRDIYNKLIEEFGWKDAWEFERIISWFKETKISISEEHIKFSHPSYYGAEPYVLVKDGFITHINKQIYSKLLLRLSTCQGDIQDIVDAVKKNFRKLPIKEGSQMLLNILKGARAIDRRFRTQVAAIVANNTDIIPDKQKSQLLLELSESYYGIDFTFTSFEKSLNNLSSEVIIQLLLNISSWGVDTFKSPNIKDYFDKLPDEISIRLLLKLSRYGQCYKLILENFDKLTNEAKKQVLLNESKAGYDLHSVPCVVEYLDRIAPYEKISLLADISEHVESVLQMGRTVHFFNYK